MSKKRKGPLRLSSEVVWFAQAMEAKLEENDHKGSWSDESFSYLMRRLKQEVEELKRRLPCDGASWTVEQAEEILREAADVGNFAMMIADIAEHYAGVEEEDLPAG